MMHSNRKLCLGLPCRNLHKNHQKELLRGLWVTDYYKLDRALGVVGRLAGIVLPAPLSPGERIDGRMAARLRYVGRTYPTLEVQLPIEWAALHYNLQLQLTQLDLLSAVHP